MKRDPSTVVQLVHGIAAKLDRALATPDASVAQIRELAEEAGVLALPYLSTPPPNSSESGRIRAIQNITLALWRFAVLSGKAVEALDENRTADVRIFTDRSLIWKAEFERHLDDIHRHYPDLLTPTH